VSCVYIRSSSCWHQNHACALMNSLPCLPTCVPHRSVNVTDVFTHDLTLAELKTLRCVQKDPWRPHANDAV
jgi:hypothetical protein